MTIAEFKNKYGTGGRGLQILVGEYIYRAPIFPGDDKLAKEIGMALADLSSALGGEEE